MVRVTVIAVFAVGLYVLTKWASLQISHTFHLNAFRCGSPGEIRTLVGGSKAHYA
jgi:hypothetical protein